MYLLLAIIGLGWLAMIFVTINSGSYLGAAVLLAAFVAFFALWKWKKSIPEEVWSNSRFKYGRIVRIAFGVALFAIAMVQLGVVARTFWANYFGEESHSADVSDIYFVVIMAVFALALIGYERLAGILFMELFFSTMLAGCFLRLLAGPGGQESGMGWAGAFALAFLIVFALGKWFHWSKGFALAGMLFMIATGLGFYLTM